MKFQKLSFLDIYEKKIAHPLSIVWSFSWSAFGINLVRGPKASRMHCLEIGLWKCYHEV